MEFTRSDKYMSLYFLSFLYNHLPAAASNAKKMEEIFFADPSGALVKARLFIEEIIHSVWDLENLEDPRYTSIYEKLKYLYEKGYIENEIYQSFNVIRKAGNKASHEADFLDMPTAYAVHKEMYHIAVWYFEVYTTDDSSVPLYEVPQIPKQENVDIEELVKEQVRNMMSTYLIKNDEVSQEVAATTTQDTAGEYEIKSHNLEKLNGSYLYRELSRLQISSAEAVENAQSFSGFKKYLHIKRPIQEKIEEVLTQRAQQTTSNLIFLSGSVGDGKSHLLAYLNEEKKDIMSQYRIFNDATESFSPSKTALETLEEILQGFSDQKIDESNEKVIIAINLGVLHNFIYREHEHYTYERLKQFVEGSGLFSSQILTHHQQGVFDIISFADYQMYELTPTGVASEYLSVIIKKICDPVESNPFYKAYQSDIESGLETIVHQNYRFLCNESVQKRVVQTIIQAIVQYKIQVSSRHYLNFIADILIPTDELIVEGNEYKRLEHSLPNLLFKRQGRSALLDVIQKISPIHYRSNAIDELLVKLNTLTDWQALIIEKIKDETAKKWFEPFNEPEETKQSFDLFVESFVATLYLADDYFAANITNKYFEQYIAYLYAFNKVDVRMIKEFYKNLKTAIFNWQGAPKSDYVYLERLEYEIAIAQKLKLSPETSHLKEMSDVTLYSFKPAITVGYKRTDGQKTYLEIDYTLFVLLDKVVNGYRPSQKDIENATTWIEFLERLMVYGDQKEELLFDFIAENKKYALKKEFGGFVFEKVE